MNHDPQNEVSPKTIEQVYKPMTRRTFLKGAAASMVGVAGLMAALKPLLELESGAVTLDDLLQKHYRELKPEDLKRIMAVARGQGGEGIRRAPEPARRQAAGRRGVWLRAEPDALHRLPQMRPRLPQGEQPVARRRRTTSRCPTSACWR